MRIGLDLRANWEENCSLWVLLLPIGQCSAESGSLPEDSWKEDDRLHNATNCQMIR